MKQATKSISTLYPRRKAGVTFRKPNVEDGSDIWALIQACKPLDENSMYCNLLQCDHFRDTCVIGEINGETKSWVSGYLVPDDPETLFIWQVAVDRSARGRGLGGKMLGHILDRDCCSKVKRLQTTITSDNKASWTLFRRFAEKRGAVFAKQPHFIKDAHFDGAHSTEHMVTITLPETRELDKAA